MIEKYRIEYATRAKKDLRDIYTYISFSLMEKQTAKNLSRHIRKEIRSLDTFPERYPKVEWEPWASLGTRKMSVDRYIVYYRVDVEKKMVFVTRVVYGGRDMEHIINADWD